MDLAIVGAGAAGLFAAIWAGRAVQSCDKKLRIVAIDGAAKFGAKILVSGGGRCNVTHEFVDESAFAGGSRAAIRRVLRSFDVEPTIAFFAERGVTLKREETGKLFPTSDSARTVLDALLTAATEVGVRLDHPNRIESIEHRPDDNTFRITGSAGEWLADRVILATGGRSLPKTGSDGHGYTMASALGHSVTPRIFPALVPLTVDPNHFITTLSGITVPATLEVRSAAGKKLVSFTNSTLLTHFGLSGPSALDISRFYLDARQDDPSASLVINWLPGEDFDSVERAMLDARSQTAGRWARRRWPERLALALLDFAGLDHQTRIDQALRDRRRAFVHAVTAMRIPVTGSRGYKFAEVTAGGVPLSEVKLQTMESRPRPGLHLCGEILDVDGRIGGYNFQWAWASGYLAGVGAVRSSIE